ncbi:ribonuclease H-like domain-containing protein [Tanacetum coccineum]
MNESKTMQKIYSDATVCKDYLLYPTKKGSQRAMTGSKVSESELLALIKPKWMLHLPQQAFLLERVRSKGTQVTEERCMEFSEIRMGEDVQRRDSKGICDKLMEKVNAVSTVGGKRETVVKPSAGCNWRPQRYHGRKPNDNWGSSLRNDYPHRALKNKGIIDSGCSRHMTGNKAYLAEFQDFMWGSLLLLEHFNLFSVSQMCDKKNKVLFTDSECLVLSSEFKLPDENQVLLKIPRQNNMYSFNLENIVPSGGLACLIAKATTDESNKWHRRLGHVNFKNLNKLVKGNLVRGLPSKLFQNDHTCVACQKGKQHKASWKGPTWLFDLDYLTDSMNYHSVSSENQANLNASQQEANLMQSTEEIIDVRGF